MDWPHLFRTRRFGLGVVKMALGVVPVLIFVFLLNQRFVFFPHAVSHLVPGQNRGIQHSRGLLIQSAARGAFRWLLNGDVFNITSRVPRAVPQVRISGTLAVSNAELITYSVTGNRFVGELTTIIWSSFLSHLDWDRRADGRISLWQREKPDEKRGYASVAEFKSDPPDMKRVAVVGLDPMAFVRPENYTPSTEALRLPSTLRGQQRVYMYAADEDLRFSFTKVDRNFQKGSDPVTIRIRRADTPGDRPSDIIYLKQVADDGITNNKGVAGKSQSVEVRVPHVKPGMYRVDLETSEEVLLLGFTSYQKVLAFAGKFYLADGPAYSDYLPTDAFSSVLVRTNNSKFLLSTNHAEGKQTVIINGKKNVLNKIRVQTTVTSPASVTEFTVDRGDLVIDGGDGLTTLDPFLLPGKGASVLQPTTSANVKNFDYLVGAYLPPSNTEKVTFDQTYKLSDLKVNSKRSIGFRLSVPDLRAKEYVVGLRSIQVDYIRGSFPWRSAWKKLSTLIGLGKS